MKVVAVMEVSPHDGGGFYQALNAVLQMGRLCEGRFEFAVGCVHPAVKAMLVDMRVDAFALPVVLSDRIRFFRHVPVAPAGSPEPGASTPRRGLRRSVLPKRLQRWIGRVRGALRKIPDLSRLDRHLARQNADLVYFVAPWSRVHRLGTLPFWATIWDLAHIEYGEFPEVSAAAGLREHVLNAMLMKAGVVLSDSEPLKALICHRYGVQAHRVVPMPFLPSPGIAADDSIPTADVLRSLDLAPGYLFYPAQFWAHKNHVRILEAARICLDAGRTVQIVFAGGDMGGRRHVEAVVESLDLADHVRFLGFVDARSMRGLYAGSGGLVMPTYFGPTNMPPLEAWTIGTPLIYSRHLADQAGDAALLVDPDDATDLAEAMTAVLDPATRERLIAAGHRRLQTLQALRLAAEDDLAGRLRRLEARLRC